MSLAPIATMDGCNLTAHRFGGDTYPVASPCPFCKVHSRVGAMDRYINPTTCYEARDPIMADDLYTATLYAEGMAKIVHDVYPQEIHNITNAILPYDEPLHPIPVGASIFYLIMTAWVTTFYFTYLGRKLLAGVKQKLDLHPEADKFPNLPLYWIQQSQREAELRREVRNTWAWLARRYLLSPNDPLLDNVDQVLGLVNWHDFEVSRTTWSLVKIILTVNSMYVKVHRNRKERTKNFEIIKDINLAKRKSFEDHPEQTTRIIIEDVDEDGEILPPKPPAMKPQEKKPPEKKPPEPPKVQQTSSKTEMKTTSSGSKAPQPRSVNTTQSPSTPPSRMDGGDSGRTTTSPSGPPQPQKSILHITKRLSRSSPVTQKVSPTPPPPPPPPPPPKSKPKKSMKPVSPAIISPKPKKAPPPSPPSKGRPSKKEPFKKTVKIGGITTAGESGDNNSTDFDTPDTADTTAGVGSGSGAAVMTTPTPDLTTTTTSAPFLLEETSTTAGEYTTAEEGGSSSNGAEGDAHETSSSTGAERQKQKRHRRRRRMQKRKTKQRRNKEDGDREPRPWQYFFK